MIIMMSLQSHGKTEVILTLLTHPVSDGSLVSRKSVISLQPLLAFLPPWAGFDCDWRCRHHRQFLIARRSGLSRVALVALQLSRARLILHDSSLPHPTLQPRLPRPASTARLSWDPGQTRPAVVGGGETLEPRQTRHSSLSFYPGRIDPSQPRLPGCSPRSREAVRTPGPRTSLVTISAITPVNSITAVYTVTAW